VFTSVSCEKVLSLPSAVNAWGTVAHGQIASKYVGLSRACLARPLSKGWMPWNTRALYSEFLHATMRSNCASAARLPVDCVYIAHIQDSASGPASLILFNAGVAQGKF